MDDARRFEEVISQGGVVVFPADTVYGLACSPEDPAAVDRLYALKGRPPDKPAAVMFFDVGAALAAVTAGPRVRQALARLLPGAVTVLLANPERSFPLACGPDPATLGLRVPDLPRFAQVTVPVLQSSANLAGAADARALADVPAPIRAGADLVLDGGELPGTPSTVLDLTAYEERGEFRVVREGAVSAADVEAALR